MASLIRTGTCTLILTSVLSACSDSGGPGSAPPYEPPAPPPIVEAIPFETLYEQGVDQYLGDFTPMLSEADGDIVQHTFGTGEGPRCLLGDDYTMATREGSSSELMIFLEGGGACNSLLCQATTVALPGMPRFGILNPEASSNPARNFNVAYLPYCDGSVFSGDTAIDTDDDGVVDRYHHGLKNLSASIDVIASTFPAPSRILLTGNSAGGFGTDYMLPLVRKLFPDTPIDLINDSGVGISRPGYVDFVSNEWNATRFIPEDCSDCVSEAGHTTGYHIYQLNEDPNLRMGFMSTKQDSVIADVFVGIGGEAFEVALLAEMETLAAAHPERFKSFIADGTSHTFLQAQFSREVEGVPAYQWVADMLSGSADWRSLSD
ncbi:MAG: pectin acetylesterase-family hydrolase [Luminiphilus sp.]|nr:pectin acetylesterase-family hydrolase [Luminiphilus sp.]